MKELTSRLRLRAYRDEDAAFLLDMYERPEVLRYLTKARLADHDAAAVRARKRLDADPVLDHTFTRGVGSVIALTTAVNEPSQRVCRRLGMRDLGMTDRYYDGAALRLFEAITPG